MPKLRLVETSHACPEQYDVFLGDEEVGYLYLRHGRFVAYYGCANHLYVYSAATRGDGRFEDDERRRHLNRACAAILNAHAEATAPEADDLFEITEGGGA